MLRKISLLSLVAIFSLGLLAFAGCGGDDEDEGSGGGSATTEQTATPETTAEAQTPAPSATEDSGGASAPAGDVDAAIDACKSAFTSTSQQVPEDAQGDIDDLCEKAANGDTAGAQKAAKNVCRKLIEANVPEGTPAEALEQGIKACESTVPSG